MTIIDRTREIAATPVAADPFALVGSRFALSGSSFVSEGCDEPSAASLRPRGLRRARRAAPGRVGSGRVVPRWID